MVTLANVGVPMLVVHVPLLVVAMVPIVVIEAWWVGWRGQVSMGRLWKPVLWANVVSMVFGVPLTWAGLVIVQMVLGWAGAGAGGEGGYREGEAAWSVIVQAPWMMPDSPGESSLGWRVPVAAMVLSPFFYVTSAVVEYWVLRRAFVRLGIEEGRRHVWVANAWTYGLIVVYWAGVLVYRS